MSYPCPFCQHKRAPTVETRRRKGFTKRRRVCANCKKKFSTFEFYGIGRTGVSGLPPMQIGGQ